MGVSKKKYNKRDQKSNCLLNIGFEQVCSLRQKIEVCVNIFNLKIFKNLINIYIAIEATVCD